MTSEKRRFSTLALLVIVAGLLAVSAVVISLSLLPMIFPTTAVTSVEQVKRLVDSYLTGINSDLRIKEIMEFSEHFYIMVHEKSTG